MRWRQIMHKTGFKIHNGGVKVHELWKKNRKKKDNKGEKRDE